MTYICLILIKISGFKIWFLMEKLIRGDGKCIGFTCYKFNIDIRDSFFGALHCYLTGANDPSCYWRNNLNLCAANTYASQYISLQIGDPK